MHLISFASSWVLWNERNDMLFCGQERSLVQLLENVQPPFGGLKLNLLYFHIDFIIGAKTFSYVRVLASFVYFN